MATVAISMTIDSPLGKDALEAVKLQGVERLSSVFEFVITAKSKQLDLDFSKIIGANVTLTIKLGKMERFLSGIVGHFQQQYTAQLGKNNFVYYQIKVYPKFWQLKFSRDFVIYQKKSALDIIEEVLKERGVDIKNNVTSHGKTKREYCVQYGESHFDFVSRLMEEEGIFYFFEYAKGSHKMILADDTAAHKACPNADKAFIEHNRVGIFSLNRIQNCQITHNMYVGACAATDYNYLTPSTDLLTNNKGQGKGLEVYDYPGCFLDHDGSEKYIDLNLERQEIQGEVFSGQSTIPFFTAGFSFHLENHARQDANEDYVLFEVNHQMDIENEMDDVGIYHNFYKSFPKKTPFRPQRITRKPRIHGTQTALVTGKSGEEITTDDLRRIKVHFYWDRKGKKDETSSLWIRVASGWAGGTWGILHTPRIGHEVVVSFINGDPDRPLVTGCVYNKEMMPPYDTPTKSTIKSQSSKDKKAGYNEIRFEDEKDKEEIFVHAEKDKVVIVENNHDETIKKGHQNTEITTGDRNVVLKADGDKGTGNDSLTLDKGNVTILLKSEKDPVTYALTIKKGDYTKELDKGAETITLKKGDRSITLKKGDETKTLDEGDQKTTLKKGDCKLTLDKGDLTIDITGSITIKATKKIEIKTDDELEIAAKKKITIKSDDEVEIKSEKKMTLKSSDEFKASSSKKMTLASDDEWKATAVKDMKLSGDQDINIEATQNFKLNGNMKGTVSASTQVKVSSDVSVEVTGTTAKVNGDATLTLKGGMTAIN